MSPGVKHAVVDVRDVARAVFNAIFAKYQGGKRYIVCGHILNSMVLVETLRNEFSKYGYEIPVNKMGKEEIRNSGNCVAQMFLPMMGREVLFSNERSVEELGVHYTDVEKTVIDMGYSVIKNGVVKDRLRHFKPEKKTKHCVIF